MTIVFIVGIYFNIPSVIKVWKVSPRYKWTESKIYIYIYMTAYWTIFICPFHADQEVKLLGKYKNWPPSSDLVQHISLWDFFFNIQNKKSLNLKIIWLIIVHNVEWSKYIYLNITIGWHNNIVDNSIIVRLETY